MVVPAIKDYLETWFDFPNQRLFCQVSTVHEGSPRIRSMDLYDYTPDGTLVFFTSTNTPKWHDLQLNPQAAVCFLNTEYGQLCVEGKAALYTSITNLTLATHYWENFLDDYWRAFYTSHNVSTLHFGIPTVFGILVIRPQVWEVLEINPNDFLKGSRKKYQVEDEAWQIIELPLV